MVVAEYESVKNELYYAFSKVGMRPVIYDEIESFSENNSYPFQPRKSDYPLSFFKRESNEYPVHTLNLIKSRVCINDDIMQEILFWKPKKCDIGDNSMFDYNKIKSGTNTQSARSNFQRS